MFKRTLFSFILGLLVFSASAFSETAEQKIIRESYEDLNGDLFEFANPTTRLPESLFEKRIHPVKKTGSYYSIAGIRPSFAIEKLFDPEFPGPRVLECNTAASLVRLRLLMHRLGGAEEFDSYMQIQPVQGVVFSPRVVLGNPDESGPYLSAFFFESFVLEDESRLKFETMPIGTTLSIKNHDHYLDRHYFGSYMAENVLYYGLNDRKEPVFYGFKGLFSDRQPHTLLEIRRHLLSQYLTEPSEKDRGYSSYYLQPVLTGKIEREVQNYWDQIHGSSHKEDEFAMTHAKVVRTAHFSEKNIFALKNIRAGLSVPLSLEPVLEDKCQVCLRKGKTLRCAGACTDKPHYCSKECQKKDWGHHKSECLKEKKI